jgi:hypothetical protein
MKLKYFCLYGEIKISSGMWRKKVRYFIFHDTLRKNEKHINQMLTLQKKFLIIFYRERGYPSFWFISKRVGKEDHLSRIIHELEKVERPGLLHSPHFPSLARERGEDPSYSHKKWLDKGQKGFLSPVYGKWKGW